jgi:hypothetical protein
MINGDVGWVTECIGPVLGAVFLASADCRHTVEGKHTMPHTRKALLQAWRARDEGRPLPPDLRAVLERRLGADLSAVRVHIGPAADAAARAYAADAVANGSAVFFRAGAYRPDDPAGLHLIAHEVAHTVQQASGRTQNGEQEADRFADAMVADRGTAGGKPMTMGVWAGPTAMVQRHSSFEHRYLGDGPTQDLVDISLRTPNWTVKVQQQIALMKLWDRKDPGNVTEQDIATVDPSLRTLRLGPDRVLMTYGELNALPDYLANPDAIEATGEGVLLPVLQVIRQEGYNEFTKLLTGTDPLLRFPLSACQPYSYSGINAIVETAELDTLTAGLGANHYQGLLARNACHFAPYTWYRWLGSHLIARNAALLAYQAVGDEKARLTREAWLYHGYADHFLQDAFAAGHLIDKTLVMQWFIDWVSTSKLLPVADWDSLKYMTAALQPGLRATQLYTADYPGPSNDPQTVQEAPAYDDRVGSAGLRPARQNGPMDAYQGYLAFLTSAVAQLGTNGLHDYYNANSVWVASPQHPQGYRVWGDSTLLSGKDGADGVRATSEAAQQSQQALKDILNQGGTDITVASIRSRFPTMAGSDADSLAPLQTWNDSQRGWCEDNIFAPIVPTLKKLLLNLGRPNLGTVSVDQSFGVAWTMQIGGSSNYEPTAVLTVNGRVFTFSNGAICECDPTSGIVKQSVQISGSGDDSAVLCSDGTTLYVGAYGRVYALPLATPWTGVQWTSALAGGANGSGPVEILFVRGRLYTGCNGYVGELRIADGVFLRLVLITSSIGVGDYRTRLSSDGRLLYAGVHAYAYALSLQDVSQKPLWTSPALSGTFSYAQVTPLASGGKLFAASNGFVYELNTSDGTIVRQIRLAAIVGTGDYTASLATDSARLYAGIHGYTYALPVTGAWNSPVWTSPRLGGTLISFDKVSLVFTGDQLFAGTNGSIYELDLFTGAVKQSAQITSSIGVGDYSTGLSTDGSVLCAGTHGYAYRLQMVVRAAAPRAYWKMNQNSGTAVPDERGIWPATATAVTWQVLPGAGGAAVFNGTSSAIATAGTVVDTGPSGSFTVSAWARADRGFNGRGTVVGQDARNTSAFSLLFSGLDQTWVFERPVADTPGPAVALTAKATIGAWTLLAGVYDATAGKMRFYVNGAPAGSADFSPAQAFASTGPLTMGRGIVNGSAGSWLPGAVREVKVYQRALDPLELLPSANAYWKLDDDAATVADTTGSFPATATNVTWNADPGIGTYAVLNGASSSVATTGPAVYTGQGASYTVSAWVRLDSLPQGSALAVSQDATTTSAFSLGFTAPTSSWAFTRALADDGSGRRSIASVPIASPLKVWTQITGVYDAQTQKLSLYLNGQLATSVDSVFLQPFASGGALLAGQGKGTSWFAGAVRDVRVYGQALSAAQIAQLIIPPAVPTVVKQIHHQHGKDSMAKHN